MVPTKRARCVPVIQPFLEARFMENMSTREAIYLCIWFEIDQANGTFLFGGAREGVVPKGWGSASEFLHVGF